MNIIYLQKLTATNDIFLSDPTAFATAVVVTPQPQVGGGWQSRQLQDLLEREARERREEEEVILIIQCVMAAIEEEECQLCKVA